VSRRWRGWAATAGVIAAGAAGVTAAQAQDEVVPPEAAAPAAPPAATDPLSPAVPAGSAQPPTTAVPAPPLPPVLEAPPPEPAPAAARRPVPRHRKKGAAERRSAARAGTGGPATPAPNDAAALALPDAGPSPLSDVLLGAFRVPPFLLPIYQAAGTAYGVPWTVLAAINEIETDYGRNVARSSAGAIGWMQFLPTTWGQYGVDANGDGRSDPGNPVDAIFAAARYLHAAGADRDPRAAIFAYNHADWYVRSVLLRAKLLGSTPSALIGALTGLADGRFPVAGGGRIARARTSAPERRVLAPARRRVVAVQDATVLAVGRNATLGRYVRLRDGYGNTYTYAGLGSVVARFPVPDARVAATRGATRLPDPALDPAPRGPATAGDAVVTPAPTATRVPRIAGGGPGTHPGLAAVVPGRAVAPTTPLSAAERLLRSRDRRIIDALARIARRSRTAWTPAAAALAPLRTAVAEHLDPVVAGPGPALGVPLPQLGPVVTSDPQPPARAAAQATHAPASPFLRAEARRLYGPATVRFAAQRLRPGARVVAGTTLGRIGHATAGAAPALRFRIRPAGHSMPAVDPRPLLQGWRLLDASSAPHRGGAEPWAPAGDLDAGRVLLAGKAELTRTVLADPRVAVYPCGRDDLRAGAIDRRVLAVLEFLASSGLRPSVTALRCGHSLMTASGNVSEHVTGDAVDIAAVNGIPIAGHQGAGSITETTIRRLLTLQGTLRPHQIISLMTFPGADNTLALPDHADHIHVGFRPSPAGTTADPSVMTTGSTLPAGQWRRLLAHLNRVPNPKVS
jgi:soluble lytic murein transglycosylase-like protein